MDKNNADRFFYKGAIHIHTKLSDGTGDLNSITKAAKKAGLDWIVITDHNYYDTEEGIINGVYVIKAQEVSPIDKNHYLTFEVNETIEPNENPNIYIDSIRAKGGFGFAAHPDEGYYEKTDGEIYPRRNSYHCIPWTDKNIKPDGIEIWNWFSNWTDNLDDSNIFTLAYAYFFKNKIVKSPSKLTLEWWDKLNKENEIVPAIGGVDAHALKIYKYIIPLTIFPYKTCFKTICNIIHLKDILSSDFDIAKKQILNAIRNGNNIIINQKICNTVPEIYITNSSGKYYCGDKVINDNNCYLHFESNKDMKIYLIYNEIVQESLSSANFIYPINQSGKYRLEVLYKNKGYLYTNPFRIEDKKEYNE